MNTGSNYMYFVSGRVVPCNINKETGFEDGAMLFFGEFSADPSFFFFLRASFFLFSSPKRPWAYMYALNKFTP